MSIEEFEAGASDDENLDDCDPDEPVAPDQVPAEISDEEAWAALEELADDSMSSDETIRWLYRHSGSVTFDQSESDAGSLSSDITLYIPLRRPEGEVMRSTVHNIRTQKQAITALRCLCEGIRQQVNLE